MNGIAGVIFILVAQVDWTVVVLIAVGSVIGGQLGATVGRRLSPLLLRVFIVVVGLVVPRGLPPPLTALCIRRDSP